MGFTDACNATRDAERTLNEADRLAGRVAKLLVGRLRKISPHICSELKKELKSFNAVSHEWKP